MLMLWPKGPRLEEQRSVWTNLVKFMSDYNKAGVEGAGPPEDQAKRHL